MEPRHNAWTFLPWFCPRSLMDFGWYVPCNVKLCSVIWCNVNVLSLYSAAAAADAGQPASKKAVPGNKTLWL